MLPVTDPRKSSSLTIAASAYFYDGDPRRADRLLQQSAEAAEARGAYAESADNLVRMMFVASARRDWGRVQILKDRTLAYVIDHDMAEAERSRFLRLLADAIVARR